ncbi:UDP-3-O-acyl-N-acetylglucosamine deacetylase [Parvularcula maris]|uniref:UDP-3-O-acyl-N-acetylglucosamine deacetylase n=1 Tax=Parvularcula maris TaxID=2965077 RepID=A0A9X2L7Z4_9PROT|nr:UDP-3-O-acyl-N-acetylglucosamine deacetylase [Parvularcula maris]MCQ8184614.1 UDP-3-O-acyl-N-acetylglucosamine deacetylase [Parvularcula maris]
MFDEPANDTRAAATVRATVRLQGVGLHSGETADLVIEPAAPGAGISFIRSDLDGPVAARTVPADPHLVTKTQLGTVLTNGYGASVSTVEHLMAAFAMLGITEAKVSVSGPEIPILDGSAACFVDAIEAVGVLVFPSTVEPVQPSDTVTVTLGDAFLTAEPLEDGCGADLVLDVTIAFDDPAIGEQRILIEGDRETVLREVAAARTFTFLKDVEYLRTIGLARGGSLDNAVVIDEGRVLNEGGLRMEREFVRHKALDLIGDLYLMGVPLGCKITAYKPGHTINTMLAQALTPVAVEERIAAVG